MFNQIFHYLFFDPHDGSHHLVAPLKKFPKFEFQNFENVVASEAPKIVRIRRRGTKIDSHPGNLNYLPTIAIDIYISISDISVVQSYSHFSILLTALILYMYVLYQMTSTDKDYRFMATNDLMSELQKDSIKLDDDSEKKVVRTLLKLLEDKNGEVQNLAVKWFV